MLSVQEASLSFGGIHALSELTFEAKQGEITAIIGPNGAGKTSLFNIISGFYKPQAGRVFFQDQDITHARPDKRAALGIARTFQNIALFRGMTVLENIKLGSHSRLKSGLFDSGIYYGAARREEIALRNELERDVIDFLELDHIRNLHVATLPYGLQKRVELARALALQPKVLLLDEPFGMLDSLTRGELQDILIEIWNKEKITAVMITHDVDEAIF